jgi:hypothetical protein
MLKKRLNMVLAEMMKTLEIEVRPSPALLCSLFHGNKRLQDSNWLCRKRRFTALVDDSTGSRLNESLCSVLSALVVTVPCISIQLTTKNSRRRNKNVSIKRMFET